MKRIFTLALAAIMLFSMTACGAANMNDPSSPTTLQNPPTVSDPTVSTPTQKPSEPTEPTMSENVVSMMVDYAYKPQCYAYPMSNGRIQFTIDVDPNLYPDMEITLDVTWDRGYLVDKRGKHYSLHLTSENNFYTEWRMTDEDITAAQKENVKAHYFDAVIRANGNIVGYCLIEVGREEYWHTITRAEMMVFPMVDGQLQYISEEYIADLIAQRRAIVTPFDLEEKQAEYEAWCLEQANKNKKTEP